MHGATGHFSYIAGLFVVVSWISFVVPPDVIPGRMALLVTLFLVLVNIFNTVTSNTPKAEGEVPPFFQLVNLRPVNVKSIILKCTNFLLIHFSHILFSLFYCQNMIY
jgi:hypothetical protein